MLLDGFGYLKFEKNGPWGLYYKTFNNRNLFCNVICHFDPSLELSVISVILPIVILPSVILLGVILLTAISVECHSTDCHYKESHSKEC